MFIVTQILVLFVALLHLGFLVLEMFLWTKEAGLKIFRMTPEIAASSATLAGNQGLYNGFLAAGLIWTLLHPDLIVSRQLGIFFLSCVLVAGLYGAATVSKNIFVVQALPAFVALLMLFRYWK
jgi:putative membrane protein